MHSSATAARTLDQALHTLHVVVVPMQFIGDVSDFLRAPGNYLSFAKHTQQVSARGTQISAGAKYWSRTVAVRYMPDQESLYFTLVE